MASLLDYDTPQRSLLAIDPPRIGGPGGLLGDGSSGPGYADAMDYWLAQLEQLRQQGVTGLLAPAPNTDYGSVLPIARNNDTGELRIALPEGIRAPLRDLYSLATEGPASGTVTPEQSAALASLALPGLLAKPEEGVLSAFSGSARAARETAIEARAAKLRGDTPLDRTIAATEAKQEPFSLVSGLEVAPGETDRVSTRIPTAKSALLDQPDPHTVPDLTVGLDSSRASTDAYANNAVTMRNADYPDLPVKGLRSPDSITQAAIGHMKDNLIWLHDQMLEAHGQDAVDRASRWYDGANAIVLRWADELGLEPRQVAGLLANLSPQKDWYQNVSLAGRMADIVQNQKNTLMTPEMYQWASDYIDGQQAAADTPVKQAAVDALRMSLAGARNVRFGQLNDPRSRTLWIRAYDEAHNTREYPIVTPEGDFEGIATNDDGTPRKVGWGSFTEMQKALTALEAGDLPTISRSLGGNHKVRNFYNNIIAPNSDAGDVTIDTHAIAAAHARPLSGTDSPVALGLGLAGSSDARTGSQGGYGIYAEAYRQAAKQLGLQPRQLQSITWEAVRGMFSPAQKRDVAFWNGNYDIWNEYKQGRLTADEARQQVLKQANGIEAPSWLTGQAPEPEE